jgi:hypothetical protein
MAAGEQLLPAPAALLQAPAEVFELFRGRTPSTEPLLRHNGLTPAAA